MIKAIAIIGKSGAGKDTILTQLQKIWGDSIHIVRPYTTRPRRNINDNMYHFITEEEAKEYIDEGFLTCQCFNNWYYGIHKDAFSVDKINILITDPTSLIDLMDSTFPFEFQIIEICANDRLRLRRSLDRGDNIKEILRRYETDEYDFSQIKNIQRTKLINENTEDYQYCARNIGLLILGENN